MDFGKRPKTGQWNIKVQCLPFVHRPQISRRNHTQRQTHDKREERDMRVDTSFALERAKRVVIDNLIRAGHGAS